MLRKHATSLIVAISVVGVTLDSGGAGLAARSVAGILLWWAILVSLGLGLTPRRRPTGLGLALVALFGAFTLLTGLSIFWADSAERALVEFDRVSLYFALVVFVVIAADFREGGRWANGLALGLSVAGVLALGQRLFPDAFPASDLALHIPNAATRLSYPIGYWNGLGIFLGIAFPLLLRAAVAARSPLSRAAALAPAPILVAAIFLTSSRGGAAVAVISVVLFLAFTPRRLGALLQALVGAGGGLVAIVVLNSHPVLVDGPLTSSAVNDQGPVVAVLVALVALLTGAIAAVVGSVLPQSLEVGPTARRVVTGIFVVVLVGAVVASNPGDRIRTFKAPPAAPLSAGGGFTQSHLFSGGGNGRWQFWSAAVDEFDAHPLAGGGAGSFQAWWAQHGSLAYFVRNAHSLYLETLGELGILGLLLLAGSFAVGLVAAFQRLRAGPEDDRLLTAALLGSFVAFAAGAAVDWVWQFAAIGGVGVVCLALLTAPGGERRDPTPPRRGRRGLRGSVAAVAIGLLAWAFVCAQAVPLLADNELRASESAAGSGKLGEALKRAEAARSLEPWAASPRLQAALVAEQAGDLDAARRFIASAIDHDPSDWQLWLVSARLETKAGRIPDARRALAEARRLNPHTPILR
jgi:hypothetical protein